MLNFVNGKNYVVNACFYWGSDSKDVQGEKDDALNSTQLQPDYIRSLDIYSSLSYPFFHGSLVYEDNRHKSLLRNMVDMPIVYGAVQMSLVNGSDMPGGDNVPEEVKGERFNEEVFVTGIDTYDDGESEFVRAKIHFVSLDYLKFTANMKDISTFEGYERGSKPLKELLTEMFASVGLGDRLDLDSLTVNVEVPYVSSENDTLLMALDYIYRKIFDFNFSDHEGKTYCRIVYDHEKRKYVLWKFDDVCTNNALKPKADNAFVAAMREMVSVESLVGSASSGLDAKAYVKNCGSQSILFETLDNVKFIGYDYVGNKFVGIVKDKNGESFVKHDDELDTEAKSKNAMVMGNSRLFKDCRYERTFTTSRQNGSYYDVFSEAIFNTSFMRVQTEGSMGRRAGDGVTMSFNDSNSTIYEQINGDYLITAVNSRYENDGKKKTFKSFMDLYRPYCSPDSLKSKEFT